MDEGKMDEVKLIEKQKLDISNVIALQEEDEIKKALMEVLTPENNEIWNKIEKLIQAHLNKKLGRKIKVLYNSGYSSLYEINRRMLYRLIKMNSLLIKVSSWGNWDGKTYKYHITRSREIRKYGDMYCFRGDGYKGRYLFDEHGTYSLYLPDNIKGRAHPDLVAVFEDIGERKANATVGEREMDAWRQGGSYKPKLTIKELIAGIDYEICSASDEFGGEDIEEVIKSINKEDTNED